MSCSGCNAPEDGHKVSLTPNVHAGLCGFCDEAWRRFARLTMTDRNPRGAAVVGAFRRWCAARKKVAA